MNEEMVAGSKIFCQRQLQLDAGIRAQTQERPLRCFDRLTIPKRSSFGQRWSTTELRFKSGLTAARNPTTKANWCGQFKMSAAAADEVSGNPTIRTV